MKKQAQKKSAFSKLPRWKQRIAIAKDVLLQLKLKKYIPRGGTYVEIETKGDIYWDDICDLQANKAIKQDKVVCTVCAKGAIFMSHIMKTNHCTVEEAEEFENVKLFKRVKCFSVAQLNLIETAFEASNIRNDHNALSSEKIDSARLFCNYEDDDVRLEKIMLNIIKNKGTFKP